MDCRLKPHQNKTRVRHHHGKQIDGVVQDDELGFTGYSVNRRLQVGAASLTAKITKDSEGLISNLGEKKVFKINDHVELIKPSVFIISSFKGVFFKEPCRTPPRDSYPEHLDTNSSKIIKRKKSVYVIHISIMLQKKFI